MSHLPNIHMSFTLLLRIEPGSKEPPSPVKMEIGQVSQIW